MSLRTEKLTSMLEGAAGVGLRAIPMDATRRMALLVWAATALVLLGAFIWLSVLCSPFTIDDAFISLRYAENLVRGHGLVYNPGERVEGYTNFLWVVLIAGAHALEGDSLLWSKVLGAAANLATLVMVSLAAYHLLPRPAFRGIAMLVPLLLVANYGFILWGVGGLETSLFTCLATAGLLLLAWSARSRATTVRFPWAAGLFALATLTRPDGTVLFVGGMAGWTAWSLLGRRMSAPEGLPWRVVLREQWRAWLAHFALFGLALTAHTIFRYLYYGDWVPNTAYLKMSPETAFLPHWKGLLDWLKSWQLIEPSHLAALGLSRGAESDTARVALAVLTAPAVWLALVGLWSWRRQAHALVLGFACAAWFLYLWRIYDDWMPGWRYYVPVLPTVALLVAAGLHFALSAASGLRGTLPRRAAQLALLCIAGLLVLRSADEFRRRMWEVPTIAGIVEVYRHAAEQLRAHAAPGEVLVMGDAGAIPYYSGLFTVDYAGLADKHMARVPLRPATVDKGDGIVRHYKRMRYDTGYLLSRNPSYVQLSGRLLPDGRFVAHYPEAVQVYQALLRDGRYDLAKPVFYSEATQLILVARKDAAWRP